MARALKAYIDCKALKFNLEQIRLRAPKSSILAMVKANGYGHGLIPVAKALLSADAFGVACIEEARQLRAAGIENPIFLMEGFFNAEVELPEIIRLNLGSIIHHQAQLDALIAAQNSIKDPIHIWIKINTGMHRLGFAMDEILSIWKILAKLPKIHVEGFMTHFAKADELDSNATEEQMNRFFQITQDFPVKRSLANSAGILGWPLSHQDWVRPGITLYGVSPFAGRVGAQEGLRPVMTLCSEIIAIQKPKKGESIGYGGTFVCQKDMRIGVIAVGYGDGYPRLAPAGTPVLIHSQEVPIVGRVSMDMITVDLTTLPEAVIGDPVQLWGAKLPVEKVANFMGTTAYELLTALSPRVHFELKNNES